MRIGIIEIILLESICFAGLWLWDDYVAFVLTLTITSIIVAVLLISLFAEKVERSKVPRKFFWHLFWSIFPPIIIGILYTFLIQGDFAWLKDI